ncbi:MAG: hypothetical protein ACKVQB_03510 [Bacteroidia bacterium]
MLRPFKKIILLFWITFFNINAKAQDGIDTALFKQYKVKKMWVWVKLPILPNRTLNDSCKVEIYELDTFERIVYQNNLMNCYGWGGSSESFNTYDNFSKIVFSKRITPEMETHIRYIYNSKNDIIKIIQTSPQRSDSFVTINDYIYNKKNQALEMKTIEIVDHDSTIYIIKYDYDKADNLSVIWTYTGDMQLISKQTFDITPISKKVLEFSTETKLPSEKYTKGWNYYNEYAQLFMTKYNNNTWTEFIFNDNGLLDQALSYNMEGKLNSWKRYYYEFYEGNE